MRPSSKTYIPTRTSSVQTFGDQVLQNDADLTISVSKVLNPAECNALLDAHFCIRMYIYGATFNHTNYPVNKDK